MRRLIVPICAALLLMPVWSNAQAPIQQTRMLRPGVLVQAPGIRNPWAFAVQGSYDLRKGEFSDNFESSARAILEVLGAKTEKRSGLFLVGNLSKLSVNDSTTRAALETKLRELRDSSQGVQVSLLANGTSGDPLKSSKSVWCGIGGKINAAKTPSGDVRYLTQVVLTGGCELSGLVGLYSQMPTTLSIEPSITFFTDADAYKAVFGEDRSSLLGADLTLILPAGAGRGVMIEAIATKEKRPQFRAGLLFVSLHR